MPKWIFQKISGDQQGVRRLNSLQTAFPFSEIMHLWTDKLLNHVITAHEILFSLNRDFFLFTFTKYTYWQKMVQTLVKSWIHMSTHYLHSQCYVHKCGCTAHKISNSLNHEFFVDNQKKITYQQRSWNVSFANLIQWHTKFHPENMKVWILGSHKISISLNHNFLLTL